MSSPIRSTRCLPTYGKLPSRVDRNDSSSPLEPNNFLSFRMFSNDRKNARKGYSFRICSGSEGIDAKTCPELVSGQAVLLFEMLGVSSRKSRFLFIRGTRISRSATESMPGATVEIGIRKCVKMIAFAM